jgi:hypothetical protein
MSEKSSMGSERTLAELTAELESLKSAAQDIGDDVLRALEERWAGFHSVLFPKLLDWARSWDVESIAAFSLSRGVLLAQPSLSTNVPGNLPSRLLVTTDLGIFANCYGSDSELLIERSFAARELEIDFATGIAAVPFSLFDDLVGVLIVRFANRTIRIEPSNYLKLTESTEKLLGSLRREILAGRIVEVKRAMPQVG